MKKLTFGQMRAAKLPAEKPDDADDLKSLRINCASDHPNSLKAAVSDSYAELVAQLTTEPAVPSEKPKK